MAQKRKPFHVSVLEKIVRTSPTNEAMLAADLRVTLPSVKRVVDMLVRQGDVERVEVPGYPPHLAITRQGREYLREREPGWWRTASRDTKRKAPKRGRRRDPSKSREIYISRSQMRNLSCLDRQRLRLPHEP